MTMQHFFVLTATQHTGAIANNPDPMWGIATDGGRIVDSPTPGAGININPTAVGFAVGDEIDLSGTKYVLNYSMVNDPEWLTNGIDLIDFLLELPSAILEAETIFLP